MAYMTRAQARAQTSLSNVLRLTVVTLSCLVLTGVAPASALAQAADNSTLDTQFSAAAAEFNVPKELLLALSYNQTRWEDHDGTPSASGGYGIMHLTNQPAVVDGKGLGAVKNTHVPTTPQTLPEAAHQTGTSAQALKQDTAQNLRGAAALLSSYAKAANNGQLPQSLDGWYEAVTKLSALPGDESREFADDVYATLKDGVTHTNSEGQTLTIPKQAVRSRTAPEARTYSVDGQSTRTTKAECPPTISCHFVPARYAQNNPNDSDDYGNYDIANRPKDMRIKYIVIHDTEGSYQSAISWFKDPRSYVSAQYVIRSKDGAVTQMVKNKDVAWHAGNWYMNMHSIGIEHEGYSAEGASWYSEAMYRSSAKLVRYLVDKYDIPLDREHIIGHDEVPALTPERSAAMHTDPGPYWDWNHYMQLIGMETPSTTKPNPNLVTIAPQFKANQPTVSECTDSVCKTLPKQGANFVHLRTAPNTNAPLLTDAALHPDGKPGTTDISDTSAKAYYGQRFVVAEKKGDWTAIWFNGQKGWFYNPVAAGKQTGLPSKGNVITPKAGKASIPVYGRPFPEASAYKKGVPPLTTVSLQYTIKAGQSYYAYDKTAKNDYYHAATHDHSGPGDGVQIVGNEKYIPISYNHRHAFVKASDVQFIKK